MYVVFVCMCASREEMAPRIRHRVDIAHNSKQLVVDVVAAVATAIAVVVVVVVYGCSVCAQK